MRELSAAATKRRELWKATAVMGEACRRAGGGGEGGGVEAVAGGQVKEGEAAFLGAEGGVAEGGGGGGGGGEGCGPGEGGVVGGEVVRLLVVVEKVAREDVPQLQRLSAVTQRKWRRPTSKAHSTGG